MIRFEHTEFLYALLLIPVLLIIFLIMMRWRRIALKRFGDMHVISQLIPDRSDLRLVYKFIFFIIAYALVIIGIANPQTGSRLEKVQRKGIDIMIALDVSNSMLAQDIQPDRLSRSKQAISMLIDQLEGDRLGIIIFAGNAYTQLPVTTDYAAAKLFLSSISTTNVPSQGTAIGDAISMAMNSFGEEQHNKAIVIITDGENHEGNAVEEAKAAAAKDITVYTIGMGLPDGAPIPVYNNYNQQTGFKKDKDGQTIITKLNETMLQQIASAGNGIYVRANNTKAGLSKVLDKINEIEESEIETKMFSDYEDQFQYFIAFGLFFLLIEFLIFERKSRWFRKFKLFDV
ncbi:MAG: VWA domain-containing protein [Bacteroidota bacterium]|nr:VWA domain-containing protein [Bacteroidota bacterium]